MVLLIEKGDIKLCIWSNRLDYNTVNLENELQKIFGEHKIKYFYQNDFEIKTFVRTNTEDDLIKIAQSQVVGKNKNVLSGTKNLLLDIDNNFCKNFTKWNIHYHSCKYSQCKLKNLDLVAKYYETSIDNCLLVDSNILSRKNEQNFYLFPLYMQQSLSSYYLQYFPIDNQQNFLLFLNYVTNEFK